MIKVYPPVENVQKIRLKAGDTILSAALRPDQTWSAIRIWGSDFFSFRKDWQIRPPEDRSEAALTTTRSGFVLEIRLCASFPLDADSTLNPFFCNAEEKVGLSAWLPSIQRIVAFFIEAGFYARIPKT